MDESKKLKDIKELGEFALIDHLTEKFSLKNTTSSFGVGDDAAVISISKNESKSRRSFFVGFPSPFCR